MTGTREGIADVQLSWLYRTLEEQQVTELHHGACTGADAAAHVAALDLGQIRVHVWPPVNMKHVALECLSTHPMVTIHPAMPYLDRNRQIVDHTTGLVALPKQNEQPDQLHWGGTWYTVNFAERMNKPVVICYPNGRIEKRMPTGMP